MSAQPAKHTPFNVLSSPARIARDKISELLHVSGYWLYGQSLFITGRSSSAFSIAALAAQAGKSLPAKVFFESCPEAAGEKAPFKEMKLKFLAIVNTQNLSPLLIYFAWKDLNQAFLLNLAEASRDVDKLAAVATIDNIWQILRELSHFSPAWHRFLYLLSPEKYDRLHEADLDLKEQEICSKLAPLGSRLNNSAWTAYIDSFDSLNVTGWIKKDDSLASVTVDLFLNDKPIQNNLVANGYRPDLLEAGIGSGLYGFAVPVSQGGKDGNVLAFSLRHPENGDVLGFKFFEYPYDNLECKFSLDKSDSQIKGWFISPDQPDRIFECDVYIDNIFYASVKNDRQSKDLLKSGLGSGLGGFQLDAPLESLPPGEHKVRLEAWGGRQSEEFVIELPGRQPAPIEDLSILERPVSIIIPYYENQCLERCLRSLFKYTPLNASIIIVDDASPSISAESILKNFDYKHKVSIIRNEKNLNFSASVNRGMKAAGQDDVIWLNQDAHVSPGWLQSLLLTAASQRRVGTVTPMSDKAGAFSAPEMGDVNPLPPGCTEEDYAKSFRRASFWLHPRVPTGHGFCMYIKRECLNEIGLIDLETFGTFYGQENDLCMRALRAGWLNLVDDHCYVFHERAHNYIGDRKALMEEGIKLINDKYPEYSNATRVFKAGRNLANARFAAKLARQNWRTLSKTRLLFVMAVADGGTPQTNMDLMKEFQDIAEPYLLTCDSRIMRIFKLESGKLTPLYVHELKEQLEPLGHISPEYDAVLAGWLHVLDIDLVHIRQLMWHSLNIIPIAKKLGCKLINSFHDFYVLSPNLNLIDDSGVFRGNDYCEQPSPYRARIWHRAIRGTLPAHDENFRKFWKARFAKYLALCDATVTTSRQAADIISDEMPELDCSKLHIIPHGRNFGQMRNCKAYLSPWQTIRLLVPGNIGYQKGSAIILALAEYDRKHADRLQFHVLGNWLDRPDEKVVVHGPYERDEFQQKAMEISPHIGLIPSIWCETWCHTLTELWASGLPAIAFDIGTHAARIRETGAGFILSPNDDIPAIYDQILKFMDSEEAQIEAERGVKNWQAVGGRESNARLMAARYYSLYKRLLTEEDSQADRLVAVCTRASLGTSHLRTIEPGRNDFRRGVTYVYCNGEELLAYARSNSIQGAIIQRNLLPRHLVNETIKILKANKIPYIYEFDDDLFNIPAHIGSWYSGYRDCITHMMRNASRVTVSTNELQKRYGKDFPHTIVSPFKLSSWLWKLEPRKRQLDSFVRALYHGTSSHKKDLLAIWPALKRVAEKYPAFRLLLLGLDENGENFLPENSFVEVVPLPPGKKPYPRYVAYLQEISAQADFAIAPLENSYFNNAKSYLKIAEYALMGLPAIASNVLPYSDLQAAEYLDLVDNDVNSWTAALEKRIRAGRRNSDPGRQAHAWACSNFILNEDDFKNMDAFFLA